MIHSEAANRDRRAILRTAGFAVVGIAAVDWLLLGGFDAAAFGVRVAWSISFFVIAWLARRLGPRGADLAIGGLAVLSVIAWLLLAWRTGGGSSPYVWWMLTLPLLFGVLAPDNLYSSVISSIGLVVGPLGLYAAEGAKTERVLTWLVVAPFMSSLALVGVLAYRRLRAAEAEVERQRARAVEELAVSEQRRLQAEKLALVGRLAAGVAHEINNPLAYVKANLDHLRHTHTCTCRDELLPLLEESGLGIERIEQIVSTLRSFSRMDGAGIGSCSVAATIDEAARLAAPRLRGVATLHRSVPAELPSVRANHTQLVQVLVNLLVNAADAVGDAGRPGRIEVGASVEGERVVLTVTDDGPGIPAELAEQIFEPFFTTKPVGKGTGLGLALSREYLQRFDATLAVENVPGGGARFQVRLAIEPDAQHVAA